MQSPAPGLEIHKHEKRLSDARIDSNPEEKGLALKTEYKPEMCAHIPKGKSYPGPKEKQPSAQGRGFSPSTLLL